MKDSQFHRAQNAKKDTDCKMDHVQHAQETRGATEQFRAKKDQRIALSAITQRKLAFNAKLDMVQTMPLANAMNAQTTRSVMAEMSALQTLKL